MIEKHLKNTTNQMWKARSVIQQQTIIFKYFLLKDFIYFT